MWAVTGIYQSTAAALEAGFTVLFRVGVSMRVQVLAASGSMSSAAILPLAITAGTPAPGCVPAPAKYKSSKNDDLLCGRIQPDWVSDGFTEKAAPL